MKVELSKLSDEDLMRAYQGGNESAFLVLYERYASKLYGYFQNRVRDRVLTDDLFQQALMKLHKSRHTYKKGSPFAPWMFTICRSVLGDLSRKSVPEELSDEIDSVRGQVNETIHQHNETASVNLNILNEKEKRAVEGRYQDDLSFLEVSEKLGTTEANARKIVSRAIQKLKKGIRR